MAGLLGRLYAAGCSIPPTAPAEDDRRIEGLADPTTDDHRPAVRFGLLVPDMGVEWLGIPRGTDVGPFSTSITGTPFDLLQLHLDNLYYRTGVLCVEFVSISGKIAFIHHIRGLDSAGFGAEKNSPGIRTIHGQGKGSLAKELGWKASICATTHQRRWSERVSCVLLLHDCLPFAR